MSMDGIGSMMAEPGTIATLPAGYEVNAPLEAVRPPRYWTDSKTPPGAVACASCGHEKRPLSKCRHCGATVSKLPSHRAPEEYRVPAPLREPTPEEIEEKLGSMFSIYVEASDEDMPLANRKMTIDRVWP